MKIVLEIDLNDSTEEVTLEYNRRAIKDMEARGFVMEDMEKKIATNTDLMLMGALKMHHGGLNATVREQVMDAIYEQYDTAELFQQLAEMVVASIPVFNGGTDTDEKKSTKKKPVLIR